MFHLLWGRQKIHITADQLCWVAFAVMSNTLVFLSPALQWYVEESLFYDIIIPKHLKNISLPSKVKREDSSGPPRWLNKSKDFQTKRKWCFEKKIVWLMYLKKMHSPVGEEEEAHFYFHPVKAERATSNNFLLKW